MEALAKKIGEMAASLIELPEHLWVDYDRGADVLYVSFRKPQKAKESVLEENMILHYDGKQLVGITILNAKRTSK